jgi:hypothetical protein
MDVASQGWRSTGLEIAQGLAVAGQDAIGEAREIRRPVTIGTVGGERAPGGRPPQACRNHTVKPTAENYLVDW